MNLVKKIQLNKIIIYVYFLVPLIFFVFNFRPAVILPWPDVTEALLSSIWQAGLAAAICILLAIPMSLSLLSLNKNLLKYLRPALLLPQILPIFFTVLILFTLLNPFPMGTWGIIILFVTVNLGLATVLVAQATEQTLAHYAIVSEVFALGRYVFFKKIWWPLVKPQLFSIFLMIFSFCFCSFSIPIFASGGRVANFEMLIYEKIFIESNWPLAVSLCLVQMLFISLLSFFISKYNSENLLPFKASNYLKLPAFLACIFIYLVTYIGVYLKGLLQSFQQIEFIAEYQDQIGQALLFSIQAVFLFAGVFLVLLYIWLFDYLKNSLKWMRLQHLLSVSTLIVGFSIYLYCSLQSRVDVYKLVWATSILFFIPLFKIFLQKPVESLKRQIEVGNIFGLSRTTIIFEVIARQLKVPFFLWLSVASLWFLSDYAVSRSVGLQQTSLGTLSESFLTSYRLQLSYLMTFIILIVNFIFVGCLYGLLRGAYVIYKKFAV